APAHDGDRPPAGRPEPAPLLPADGLRPHRADTLLRPVDGAGDADLGRPAAARGRGGGVLSWEGDCPASAPSAGGRGRLAFARCHLPGFEPLLRRQTRERAAQEAGLVNQGAAERLLFSPSSVHTLTGAHARRALVRMTRPSGVRFPAEVRPEVRPEN